MSAERTIRALLATARQPADRKEARAAWVKETMSALRAAQRRVDEAWERILDAAPDDLDVDALDALPEPPEQAEFDAIYAEIRAAADHDRWPRHLHFSAI